MSYNGSGVYTNVAGNPVVTGSTISSTVQNNTTSDYATALSTAICKDGQTTITANLPMAGYRHTGVGNPTARTQYASVAGIQDGTYNYLTSVAGTNTVTATGALSLAAYATGQAFYFLPANTNTGATTINVNSIGAKNIFFNGSAMAGGELKASVPAVLIYDGTQFNLVNHSRPGMVLLSSQSASSDATIDFTTSITSLYDEYVVKFVGVRPATNSANLLVRVSHDGGSSFAAAATDYSYTNMATIDGGTPAGAGSGAGASAVIIAANASNAATSSVNGEMRFYIPSNTAQYKVFNYAFGFVLGSGGNIVTYTGMGLYGASLSAVNAIRFLMSSGNIAAGTFSLYGVVKS